jgi:Flp pilus assembly protein TadD
VLGALTGFAIAGGRWRAPAAAALGVLMVASVAGATVFRSRVNVEPDRGHAEAYLGYTLFQDGDYTRSAKLYREAAALKPDNADYWQGLGAALFHAGRIEEAEAASAKAQQLGANGGR